MKDHYSGSFDELFSRDHFMKAHYQNIHRLAIEIHKVENNLSVGDFKELFTFLKINLV